MLVVSYISFQLPPYSKQPNTKDFFTFYETWSIFFILKLAYNIILVSGVQCSNSTALYITQDSLQ